MTQQFLFSNNATPYNGVTEIKSAKIFTNLLQTSLKMYRYANLGMYTHITQHKNTINSLIINTNRRDAFFDLVLKTKMCGASVEKHCLLFESNATLVDNPQTKWRSTTNKNKTTNNVLTSNRKMSAASNTTDTKSHITH